MLEASVSIVLPATLTCKNPLNQHFFLFVLMRVSQIWVVGRITNIGTFLIRSRGAEIINCVLIGELSKTADDWHSEKMVVMRHLKLNWLNTLRTVDNIALCSRRYFCVTLEKSEPFVFCCLVIVAILHWQLMSPTAGQRRSYHEQLRGGVFVNPGDIILNHLSLVTT